MRDFTADHITTEEGTKLLATAQETIASDPKFRGAIQFTPGVSYRNLLIWRGDKLAPPFSMSDTRTRAPHDITDQSVLDEHPARPGQRRAGRADGSKRRACSATIRSTSPARRPASGPRPTSGSGAWARRRSSGRSTEQYGARGAMITAVDLLRGIAALVGWERIEVPGATGYLDTDYAAKGRAAVDALDEVRYRVRSRRSVRRGLARRPTATRR